MTSKTCKTNHYLLLWLAFILASGITHSAKAQPGWDTILTSEVRFYKSIEKSSGLFVDSTHFFTDGKLDRIPRFHPISPLYERRIPTELITHDVYLQFTLKNNADSATTLFLLPGFYFDDVDFYQFQPQTQTYIPYPESPGDVFLNLKVDSKLTLRPHETTTFLAKLKFIKTTTNSLSPILSQGDFLPTLLIDIQNQRKINTIITFVVCGIMLMMIFYSLAEFYIHLNQVFLFYSAYATLLCIMFFFKAHLYKSPTLNNYFFESYLDFILQAGGTLFYFIFLRKFTQSGIQFPVLDKVLFLQQWITITGIILFSFFYFFVQDFSLQNQLENLVKYAWSACTVFFIIFAIIRRHHLLTYLAIGHSFLFLGGFLSLFLINSTYRFNSQLESLINDSLFWYEVGIMFELVFFLVALSYKNRLDITTRAREKERLLLENEKSAIERKMAVLAAKQEERNRISADMHDELGSGVTAIRLMSELAKTKMNGHSLPELDRISNSANELISKMNTIIWTMKSSNDTVDNMISYVRAYASEFFDTTEIRCQIEHPDELPSIEMSGEKRRNVFLCIKEALHNTLKHSKASEVNIHFQVGPELRIHIRDNGIGIQEISMREFGNGLANMRKRMETIDAQFQIRNENGTLITLHIPLN